MDREQDSPGRSNGSHSSYSNSNSKLPTFHHRVTFSQLQVEEIPSPSNKTRGTFYQIKHGILSLDLMNFIPWVVLLCGLGLILIGMTYYVFHLTEFIHDVQDLSEQFNERSYNAFWRLLYCLITICLVSELFVLFSASFLLLMLFNAVFNCSKFEEVSRTIQRNLKASLILFVGVLACYLQTVLGFMRISLIDLLRQWLYESECKMGTVSQIDYL